MFEPLWVGLVRFGVFQVRCIRAVLLRIVLGFRRVRFLRSHSGSKLGLDSGSDSTGSYSSRFDSSSVLTLANTPARFALTTARGKSMPFASLGAVPRLSTRADVPGCAKLLMMCAGHHWSPLQTKLLEPLECPFLRPLDICSMSLFGGLTLFVQIMSVVTTLFIHLLDHM